MTYDVITVGGSLAGSTLASQLARAGLKVLVLEQESHFNARVRGEIILPWGVAAARRLNLVGPLVSAGAHEARQWILYVSSQGVGNRELHATPAPK
jgi:flavin-dependent dehydrogenase